MRRDLSSFKSFLTLLKVIGLILAMVVSSLLGLQSSDGMIRAHEKTDIVVMPVIPWHGNDYRYWIPHEFGDNLINLILFTALFIFFLWRLAVLIRRQERWFKEKGLPS